MEPAKPSLPALQRLKAGHVAGAIGLPEGNTFKRNVFSGKAQAFLEVTSAVTR
jgi:hypothetical protein